MLAGVLGPYREVLSVPGAPAFVAAGALARLPISMVGLGIVFLVQATTGSYGVAGAVAAVFGLVQAVASPVVARAVDRWGQARVMRPAIAVHVLGLVLLVAFAQYGLPIGAVVAAAALAGATIGSLGALVRARWSYVLGQDTRRRHTAYSLESVLDEAVFIGGPLLVTVLATQASPTFGLLAAAAAVAVGGSLLMAQHRTEPPPSGVRAVAGTGVLRSPGMVVVVLAFLFVGVIFGAVEVVTVAFTQERGAPAAAGWVLASFALGSMLAGVGYGLVQWRSPSVQRFRLGVVLLAVGVVPVSLVQEVWLLAMVGFVAGFTISPMLISGNAVVQDLVVPARLTEGLTWIATALGLGVAGGAAVAGQVVDAAGAHTAFRVPVAAGLAAAVIALAGWRWLRAAATLPTAPV